MPGRAGTANSAGGYRSGAAAQRRASNCAARHGHSTPNRNTGA